MRIYERYIFKEHLKVFLLVFSAMSLLLFIVSFLDLLDDVLEYHSPVIFAVWASILKIPLGLREIGATSILISSILFSGLLSRNLEPVILSAVGIKTSKIMRPLVVQALFLSVFLFLNNNYISPISFYKAKDIVETKIFKKEKIQRQKPTRMWIKHGDFLCYIGVFNSKNLTAKDVRCVRIKNEKVSEIIRAERLIWLGGKWLAFDISSWKLNAKAKSKRKEKTFISFFISPEDLKERRKQIREMTTWELEDYLGDLKKENIPAHRISAEIYSRIFLSFSPILMIILGFPLGITGPQRSSKKSLVLALIKGMGIGFAFWSVYYSFFIAAKAGFLPAFLSNLVPFAVFGFLGKKLLENSSL